MPSSANTRRPTALGSATQATTTSDISASSRGVRATFAPCSWNGLHFSGVRFQTASGNPLARNWRAMRPPMRPSPAKPIRFCIESRLLSALRARDHHLQGAEPVGEADHLDVHELRARAVRAHVVLAELLAALRPHHPHRAVLLYGPLKLLQP